MYFQIGVVVLSAVILSNCKLLSQDTNEKQLSKRSPIDAFSTNPKFRNVFLNRTPQDSLAKKFLDENTSMYFATQTGHYVFHFPSSGQATLEEFRNYSEEGGDESAIDDSDEENAQTIYVINPDLISSLHSDEAVEENDEQSIATSSFDPNTTQNIENTEEINLNIATQNITNTNDNDKEEIHSNVTENISYTTEGNNVNPEDPEEIISEEEGVNEFLKPEPITENDDNIAETKPNGSSTQNPISQENPTNNNAVLDHNEHVEDIVSSEESENEIYGEPLLQESHENNHKNLRRKRIKNGHGTNENYGTEHNTVNKDTLEDLKYKTLKPFSLIDRELSKNAVNDVGTPSITPFGNKPAIYPGRIIKEKLPQEDFPNPVPIFTEADSTSNKFKNILNFFRQKYPNGTQDSVQGVPGDKNSLDQYVFSVRQKYFNKAIQNNSKKNTDSLDSRMTFYPPSNISDNRKEQNSNTKSLRILNMMTRWFSRARKALASSLLLPRRQRHVVNNEYNSIMPKSFPKFERNMIVIPKKNNSRRIPLPQDFPKNNSVVVPRNLYINDSPLGALADKDVLTLRDFFNNDF